MEKLKVKLLSLKYEIELKQNNTEHLKDYIAIKVILAMLKGEPLLDIDYIDNLEEITLAYLDNWIDKKNRYKENYNLKVPIIAELNNIISSGNKEIIFTSNVGIGETEKYAEAIWLKLMILNGLVKENEIIDANQYKLKNFVTDPNLAKILKLKVYNQSSKQKRR